MVPCKMNVDMVKALDYDTGPGISRTLKVVQIAPYFILEVNYVF